MRRYLIANSNRKVPSIWQPPASTAALRSGTSTQWQLWVAKSSKVFTHVTSLISRLACFRQVNTSPGNEGVIYCLSWAPADLNCVTAATARNGVFIWDLDKGKVIQRFREHGAHPVYCVAWNQKDSRFIASCGGDGNWLGSPQLLRSCVHCFCFWVNEFFSCDCSFVRTVTGEASLKLQHSASVFGCDWNPNNKWVRKHEVKSMQSPSPLCGVLFSEIWLRPDVRTRSFASSTSPHRTLLWRSSRVMRQRSLTFAGLRFATAAWQVDQTTGALLQIDKKIPSCMCSTTTLVLKCFWRTCRVWDYSNGSCVMVLKGHKAPVRGLLWNTELPHLLITGSWDYSIRIWDTRDGANIDTVLDHGGDVYGSDLMYYHLPIYCNL